MSALDLMQALLDGVRERCPDISFRYGWPEPFAPAAGLPINIGFAACTVYRQQERSDVRVGLITTTVEDAGDLSVTGPDSWLAATSGDPNGPISFDVITRAFVEQEAREACMRVASAVSEVCWGRPERMDDEPYVLEI